MGIKSIAMWTRGLFAAFLSGGAAAVTTAASTGDLTTTEGRGSIAISASVSGIVGAALYLKKHPVL